MWGLAIGRDGVASVSPDLVPHHPMWSDGDLATGLGVPTQPRARLQHGAGHPAESLTPFGPRSLRHRLTVIYFEVTIELIY